MTFQSGGQFEGGRVKKAGMGTGTKAAVGGGGILAVILGMLFGTGQMSNFFGSSDDSSASETGTVGACTADQANAGDLDCLINATAQSLDAYWAGALPAQVNIRATAPAIMDFSGSYSTPCGSANAQTGPFYCPSNQTIYIDPSFYETLVSQFGSSDGMLAHEYVLAHEYGHHIQQITGIMDQLSGQGSGANSDSVRIELMADCLAGMWAGSASTTVDPDTGVTFLAPLTENDIRDALTAAASVGDDHIEQSSQGYVNPDSFTHGTSDQRMKWFAQGYSKGNINSCDTRRADLDNPS